jgi:orotidine-5'-phosphate decarboxylase
VTSSIRWSGSPGSPVGPLEVGRIRRACGRGFLIVTPGVRPAPVGADDQKRVMTPGEAMRAGADYLVVGRPILGAPDPLAVVREMVADMAHGFLVARRGGARARV